jgi:hypothetical protein
VHEKSLAPGVTGLQIETDRDDDGDGLFHGHAPSLRAATVQ